MDFDEGGGALLAGPITPAVYRVSGTTGTDHLGDRIEKALEAAGAGTYTDSYDEATHKMTFLQNTGPVRSPTDLTVTRRSFVAAAR